MLRDSVRKNFPVSKTLCTFVETFPLEGMRKFVKIWSLLRRVPLMFYIAGALIFEMVFIDENSFVQNIRYDRQISQLRKSVNHYQQIVDESRARLDELRSDDENLEKFARETYQMKRDNEDVFVFVDD